MTRDVHRPAPRSGWVTAALVAVAAAAAAVALFLTVEASDPDFTSLTIENPTDTGLKVSVKSSPDDSLLRLGTLTPQSSRTIESVIDQGDRWIFVVGWRDVREEFSVTRDELEASDWTVQLPESAAEEVRAEYPPLDLDEPTAPSG